MRPTAMYVAMSTVLYTHVSDRIVFNTTKAAHRSPLRRISALDHMSHGMPAFYMLQSESDPSNIPMHLHLHLNNTVKQKALMAIGCEPCVFLISTLYRFINLTDAPTQQWIALSPSQGYTHDPSHFVPILTAMTRVTRVTSYKSSKPT